MSFKLAPPACFSSSRTFSVLLPSRAPVGFFAVLAPLAALAPFFAGVVFLADLALDGVTWGFRGAPLAFVVAFGSGAVSAPAWVVCSSVVSVVIVVSPLRLITAVTTSITLVRRRSKRIVRSIGKGDGLAITAVPARSWQHFASDGSPRLNSRTQTRGSHRRAAHPAQR